MNCLKHEKKTAIAAMLVDGVGMRAISRLLDVATPTLCKFMLDFGAACMEFLDLNVRNLQLKAVQCDEMWTYVQSRRNSAWIWVALCPDTKIIVTWRIGDRSLVTGQAFMEDVRSRVLGRVEITTDAHNVYSEATERCGEALVHQIAVGGGYKRRRGGASTYAVERHNLSLRRSLSRLGRGTNGFSRTAMSLNAHLAIYAAHYNFVRTHRTLRETPAMAAGLSDNLWTLDDFLMLHPVDNSTGHIMLRPLGAPVKEILSRRLDALKPRRGMAIRKLESGDHREDSCLRISAAWKPLTKLPVTRIA